MANIPAIAGYQNVNGEAAPAKFGVGDVLTDPNGNVLAVAGSGLSILGVHASAFGTTAGGSTAMIDLNPIPAGTLFIRVSARHSFLSGGNDNSDHGSYIIDVTAWQRSGSRGTCSVAQIPTEAVGSQGLAAGQYYAYQNGIFGITGIQTDIITPGTPRIRFLAVSLGGFNQAFALTLERLG